MTALHRVRALVAGVVVASTIGCGGGEPVLALPARDGVAAWVIVSARDGDLLSAHVVTADDALHVPAPSDDDGTTVEALAFTAPLGVPPGPIAGSNDGQALPAPAASYRVELDGGPTWAEAPPSPAVARVRLPRPADDCPRLGARAERLPTFDKVGVTGILPSDPITRVVITPTAWFTVTIDEVTQVPAPVLGVQSVTRDGDGTYWLATSDALWTITDGLLSGTATRARALPAGSSPIALAAPGPGVVYGVDDYARLFRSTTATTTVIHQFARGNNGTRGTVIVDGNAVLAGMGSDRTFVRVEGLDVRTYTLPSNAEGVVSIARFAEYGILVGTNSGVLRAERLGFDVVPDPLGQLPRGAQVRALVPSGDRLYFAGNSGIFGQITPRRFVCLSTVPASSGVRFLSVLGDQILAGGLPFEADHDEVHLTRYLVEP